MDYYRPSCSDSCPVEFAQVVHDCIKSNPAKRPSAANVCERLNAALATLYPAPSSGPPAVPPPSGPMLGPGTQGPPHGAQRYSAAPVIGADGVGRPPLEKKPSWPSRFCFGISRTEDGGQDGVTVKHK